MAFSEIVVVPTYKRNELLFCCLKRIRAIEPTIPIIVFPDRGTYWDPEFKEVLARFDSRFLFSDCIGKHDWIGNTGNAMESLRCAFNAVAQRVFYVEDDVMVHDDFFSWHRRMHELFPDIFASMGWVFNHHAPIVDDIMFQPWYYSIGTCFSRTKLELIVRHACPKYYQNLHAYIAEEFADSKLNSPVALSHVEQDGLIQRILERDGTQTVVSGIAKCTHLGTWGYNKPNGLKFTGTLDERIAQTEDLFEDPWWRADIFGRPIVEREIGRRLQKRAYRYRVTLPNGWQSEVISELTLKRLPKRLNSVNISPESIVDML